MSTHAVTNQVPDFAGHNLFTSDLALVEAVGRWGGDSVAPAAPNQALTDLGALAGSAGARAWADQAEAVPPRLRTHSRTGERVDEVDFHPAWHELMSVAAGSGLAAAPWAEGGPGAHLKRAAGFVVWSQTDAGHLCPMSMTYAAVPALRTTPALAELWEPRLASRTYDPALRPVAEKAGVVAGMGMTEKQGGSDVRANTTTATPTPGGPLIGDTYRLTGHKWFTSAPMSDAFLVLAQAPSGLSCFLVPRVLDDGARNVFEIQRLKDKLGNRSNASAEIELDGTWGARVGEEGRGIRTILDMVAATRLDCVLGSAATMRQAVARAVHHTQHRSAFGARLVEQPLMRNVLVDLSVESEAATLLGLRLAHGVDEGDTAFTRLAVALGKYWVCKRTAPTVAEALECLGGNGYVEENGLARLYREAPLNSIWEGSGNVNALDVLRAVARQPESVAALHSELEAARGSHPAYDRALSEVDRLLAAAGAPDGEWVARRVVERLAVLLQGSLLVRHAPEAVAEVFLASRVAGDRGAAFGTLEPALARRVAQSVLERALPQ